jgi:hypothetical protein
MRAVTSFTPARVVAPIARSTRVQAVAEADMYAEFAKLIETVRMEVRGEQHREMKTAFPRSRRP